MTERDIQTAVFAHWKALGAPLSMMFAIPNAKAFGQPGLRRGVFDIVAINPDGIVSFLELKTDKGKLSADQADFKMHLIATGVRYAVTYGRDQPIEVLRQWGMLRAGA